MNYIVILLSFQTISSVLTLVQVYWLLSNLVVNYEDGLNTLSISHISSVHLPSFHFVSSKLRSYTKYYNLIFNTVN